MIAVGRTNNAIVLRQKRPFKIMVSAITLMAFIFNIVSYDLAWAARTPLELSPDGSSRNGGSGLSLVTKASAVKTKEINVATFALPEYLGSIKDSWHSNSQLQTPNSRTIIHIQDAHCNYAAQQKISEIVSYLNKEYGVNTVNLEGGARDYDLSIFTRIADKDMREKASDYFVKEGLVNGAERFAVNNPDKITLWGIEDTKLYIDNLNVYRESLKYKDEAGKHLNTLTRILNNLKTKIYTPELLTFDTKYSQYKAGALEFKDYLAYLAQIALDKAINTKTYANIYLLSQTLQDESKVDFKKANNQRDDLIDKLQKKLSKKSLEELVLKTVEFKSEKISQKDFYAYLTKKAILVGMDLKDFPALTGYIVYISMYNAIDKLKIMEEMDSLENRIKDSLYQDDKQKELDKLSKNLAILKNIFNISLTKDDYKYYLDNESSFDTANYASFINKESLLYKITAQFDSDFSDLDRYREEISKFYEYSFKRDNAFMKNIKYSTRAPPNSKLPTLNSILITGGFHTENLCEKFKKEGISYISIMPNFKDCDGYECPYFKVLSGEKYPNIREALPSVLKSVLAIPSPLCPAMERAMKEDGISYSAIPALPVEATAVTISPPAAEINLGGNKILIAVKSLLNFYFAPKFFESEALYKALLVSRFGKVWSLTVGNIDKTLNNNSFGLETGGIRGAIVRGKVVELTHLALFSLFIILQAPIYVNIIGNVYPIMLQRYLRIRLVKILDRKAEKAAAQNQAGASLVVSSESGVVSKTLAPNYESRASASGTISSDPRVERE
ncbi:MAG: hypothetical protein Q7S30_03720, partial [Candidatus Omnitrophota bacterium]|nr:hypothetical protein [Candidatus Omnitrophota bacterium]